MAARRARPAAGACAALALLAALLAGCAGDPAARTTTPAPVRTAVPVAVEATPAAAVRMPAAPAAPAPATARPVVAPVAVIDPLAPPAPPREFRGAWVASVANIDWPSKPGLAPAVQRAEAVAMLDRAVAIGLNAIVLQVRPAGDALYISKLEPWSESLTGEQGRQPQPLYDPLAFWVEQAHARGLELHAWFNPYRARHASARSPLALPHLGLREPMLVKRYGDMLWMDPGEPRAAAHTLAVVADVVARYDIDGVHIDDYFYPYPIPSKDAGRDGTDQPFPDDESWARFQLGGGLLSRDDWRRRNVDTLVQALHGTVHRIKPWVRFGISPFGLGKPELRPAGITGFSQYDRLYADVERWLQLGWLDYLVPQLYWPIAREGQQFPVLLDYWLTQGSAQNGTQAAAPRHVWSGLFTSQVVKSGEPLGPRAWPAREIADQIVVQRTRSAVNPAAAGHVHFSMAALMQDRDGVAGLLRNGAYAQSALTPATPWLAVATPTMPASPAASIPAPTLRLRGARVAIEPAAQAASPVMRWALWRRVQGAWRFSVLPPQRLAFDVDGADLVVVGAVDRIGQLGASATLSMAQGASPGRAGPAGPAP